MISLDTFGSLEYYLNQICLHTPGLPDEEDPDFEMLMVPSGVNDHKLQEAGFMFNMEKNVWYHQGTEFGRRKAENEEKSVEKLVNYLEVSNFSTLTLSHSVYISNLLIHQKCIS